MAFFIFPDYNTDFNGSCGPAGPGPGQTELVLARISTRIHFVNSLDRQEVRETKACFNLLLEE
jgi:hypothetical protein